MIEPHFKPTLRMASAARRGLRLPEKFTGAVRKLASNAQSSCPSGILLDARDVKSMHSFCARHEVDKDATGPGKAHRWNSDRDPSASVIAWLLRGGTAGKVWAAQKIRALG
ncbi:hypothetical protein [Novosphingobium rosa]|uniref:hypothetical protein n=1 Tax=Novosphingobium rosa TaxID=76978 RepID=UPI000837709A|nr:hypothetical protein [Novosphingobium rosa]